ncbi:UNVERIFIED_CONTAM: hypothetical protein HDU68_000754, partial [Siphonaria sp. JEL0065]
DNSNNLLTKLKASIDSTTTTAKASTLKLSSSSSSASKVAPKTQSINLVQTKTTDFFAKKFAFPIPAAIKSPNKLPDPPVVIAAAVVVQSPVQNTLDAISRTLSFCSLMSETDLMME